MADFSIISMESSNTSFGEKQLKCNQYDVPMTLLTMKRIKNFYHGTPSTTINIRADTSLYVNDDMIYNKAIEAKGEEMKLKKKRSKVTKMNPFEFKMLMDLYKGSTTKLQSTKLGDYIDPYYDDPGEEEESRIELGNVL